MTSIKLVDPFRCCMWELHDRLEEDITEESCRAEIESFLKHGQLVPVLGRPLRGDDAHDVELIFGARRLFVARHLNKPLAVELREVSDREAIIAMDIENRQRTDISPYERGLGYARWLRAKFFESQEDIARTLNVSASQVSRLLKLAKLPSVIVSAFSSTTDICENWGLDLLEIWEDPQRRRAVARQARTIGAVSPRPAAQDVYRQLLASSVHGRRPKRRAHDEVVTDDSGAPLFRIRRQAKSIALLLPVDKVSASCLDRVRDAVTQILHDASSQSRELERQFSKKLSRAETPLSPN
jgi:ParB family transcriptional regulator, chromosome partitioning protein